MDETPEKVGPLLLGHMTDDEVKMIAQLISTQAKLIDWLLQCRCGARCLKISGPNGGKSNADRQRAYRLRRGEWMPSREIRGRLTARDGDTCKACGAPPKPGKVLHIDHVKPLLHGGGNEDENLQLLCGPCNWSKGSKWES